MACKQIKQMVITILERKHIRPDWYFDFDGQEFQDFITGITKEMKRLGVVLSVVRNREGEIAINSYADLLNVVKISSHQDGHSNQCVGHIIGKSEHLDIMEDIRAAVRRVAFAPETVAPYSEFRKVCHNCGCGC
jgi:sugar phosphate isomerase/epimerase